MSGTDKLLDDCDLEEDDPGRDPADGIVDDLTNDLSKRAGRMQ